MEVHHHPDLPHKSKKFKEYFLEFLMIFLAVTLGFFAESYREYLSDRSKEKEYIKSMIEDLKTDSIFLVLSTGKLIPYHLAWLDSTVHLLELPDFKGKARLVYQAFLVGTAWTYNFHPTERTLTQLHSEGFHLIRNENAIKIIGQLEDRYKFYFPSTTFTENMQNDIDLSASSFADRDVTSAITTEAFQHFADSSRVDLQLTDIPESATINADNKEAIKSYIDKIRKYYFYLQYSVKSWHIILLKEINSTINILKKEYHLQ